MDTPPGYAFTPVSSFGGISIVVVSNWSVSRLPLFTLWLAWVRVLLLANPLENSLSWAYILEINVKALNGDILNIKKGLDLLCPFNVGRKAHCIDPWCLHLFPTVYSMQNNSDHIIYYINTNSNPEMWCLLLYSTKMENDLGLSCAHVKLELAHVKLWLAHVAV